MWSLFQSQGIHCCQDAVASGKQGPMSRRESGNWASPIHCRKCPKQAHTPYPSGALHKEVLSVRTTQMRRAVTIATTFPAVQPRPDMQLVKCLTGSNLRQKVTFSGTLGKKWVGDVEQWLWYVNWEGKSFNKVLCNKRKSIQYSHRGHPSWVQSASWLCSFFITAQCAGLVICTQVEELLIPFHFLLVGIHGGGRHEQSLCSCSFWLISANAFFLFITGFCASSQKTLHHIA